MALYASASQVSKVWAVQACWLEAGALFVARPCLMAMPWAKVQKMQEHDLFERLEPVLLFCLA